MKLENIRMKDNVDVEWYNDIEKSKRKPKPKKHPLDSEENRKRLKKLNDWWEEARTNQAVNREQQDIDDRFVDGDQWPLEEQQLLESRNQAPLVFNVVLPAALWIQGTEKRTRVDWNVLPRTENDVEAALTKTKLLKYVSDVNKSNFIKSLAFEDSVRAGVGWMEIGIRADAEKEMIFVRHESWRNIWFDPLSVEPSLEDARFLFRSKIIDKDIAVLQFPHREDAIEAAATTREQLSHAAAQDFYDSAVHSQYDTAGTTYIEDALNTSGRRQLVRMIECWYKEPAKVQIMRGNPQFEGMIYKQDNPEMSELVSLGQASLYNAIRMITRIAVFIEGSVLCQDMASPYRHNKFPFIPIWAYRRRKDNSPYGIVRNVRDPQFDLNKRRSKALFLLSTNRTVMDEGAVPDLDEFEEEVAKPNAIIIKRPGKELNIENIPQLAEQHIALAMQDADYVREAAGVTGENLGLDTNAISGKAILAKQNQGTVVTATLFDNLRLAVQLSGEITLSLIEQFYTEEKVIRITEKPGTPEFMAINQQQPGGEMLNDITRSQADFIVSEQDHRESIRMAMFGQLMDLMSKLDSQTAISMLDMVIEWSDLPNKDEMVRRIRKINGQSDPSDPQAQQQEQQQEQQQAEQQQRERDLAIREASAKIGQTEALTKKTLADAQNAKLDSMIDALSAALQALQNPEAATVAQQLIDGADQAQPGENIGELSP